MRTTHQRQVAGQLGIVLMKLATTEGRTDYADRAIMEFTAAIFL